MRGSACPQDRNSRGDLVQSSIGKREREGETEGEKERNRGREIEKEK